MRNDWRFDATTRGLGAFRSIRFSLLTFLLAFSSLAWAGNPTTAGLASATPGSARLAGGSLAIKAPYTEDANGNNTLLIEWGEDGVDFSLGSQPLTHAPSPYAHTITGLDNAKKYQVRLTWQDADGAPAPQVLTGLRTYHTLLHNAVSTGSGTNKWAEGWGTADGTSQYGEFTCATCHARSTTNAKRVRQTLPAGFPVGSNPVTFTDPRDNPAGSGFGDDSDRSVNRICESCHSKNKFHNHSLANNAGNTHQNGASCTRCHKHSQGFKGGGCDGCHGGGTSGAASRNFWPDSDTADAADSANNAGKHLRHMEALANRRYAETIPTLLSNTANGLSSDKQKALCAYCHPNPGADADHAGGDAAEVEQFKRLWDGSADGGTPGTYSSADGTCSNIDCHNSKTTPPAFAWYAGGASSCLMCHTDDRATPNAAATADPVSGLHLADAAFPGVEGHDGNFGGASAYGCTSCHAAVPSDAHLNGVRDTPATASFGFVSTGRTIALGAPGDATDNTCAASCHSDNNSWYRFWDAAAFSSDTNAGSARCKVCHGTFGAWAAGTSHASKSGGTASIVGNTHNKLTGADNACEDCHSYPTLASNHRNAKITVNDDPDISDVDLVEGTKGVYCSACHNEPNVLPTDTNSHVYATSVFTLQRVNGVNKPDGTCYGGVAGCHGDAQGRWWPSANSIDPSAYPNRAGAHAQHNITIGTKIAEAGGRSNPTDEDFNRTCIYCHPVTAAHMGTRTAPADVYRDGQPENSDATDRFAHALDDPNNIGSLYPLDPDGTYVSFNFADKSNQAANYGACRNIDCHGNSPYTPQWYGDFVAPGLVTSLAASTHNPDAGHAAGITDRPGTIYLSWNAPGEDGDHDGTAYQYDVRYSTSVITAANFASAQRAGGPPSPLRKGKAQSMVVDGLTPGQNYYFAIRTYDEAMNVSAITATGSAVAAHSDDVRPIFWGLDRVEQTDTYGNNGSKVTSALKLSWGAAKDHTTPISYRIWWSEYNLKTHLARGGSLPATTTSYTEGTPPVAGGSSYTIHTATTKSLSYQAGGLTEGVLYNFLVRADDGVTPTPNRDTNLVTMVGLPRAPKALQTNLRMYLGSGVTTQAYDTSAPFNISGSNSLTQQADPASPTWPGSTSATLSPGNEIYWIYNTAYTVDTNVTGISFDIYMTGSKTTQIVRYQLGYVSGTTFTPLGNVAYKERYLGKKSKRIQKLPLFDFKQKVPANAKLAIRLMAPSSNTSSVTLSYGASTNKGQLLVTEQVFNNPPSAASGIAITQKPAGGYLDIAWGASSANNGGQSVHYDVFASGNNGADGYPYVVATGLTGTAVTWDTVGDGLTGGSYTVKVKVLSGDGYLFETGQASPNDFASHVEALSAASTLNNASDTEPPAAGTIQIYETRPKQGSVFLEWTAVGNDGLNHGTRAAAYDIRYQKVSAGAFNFAAATQAQDEPVPGFSGVRERYELLGLEPEVSYYIGMKVGDAAGNWSPLSNVIQTKGGPKYCGICHSTPPDEPATAGVHSVHGYTVQDCAKCHGPEVVDYGVRHYDGKLKLGWGYNVAGGGARNPTVEATISGELVQYFQNGVKIYEDTDGSGGYNPTGTFNAGTGTHGDSGSCMNFTAAANQVSGCHGPFQPKWDSGRDGARVQPACADCHGDKTATRNLDPYGRTWDDNVAGEPSASVKASPPIDNHGYSTGRFVGAHEKHLNASFRFAKGDSCRLCHKDTVYSGLHADGKADVIFDVAADFNSSTPAVFTPNASGPDTPGTCMSLNPLGCHDTGAVWNTGSTAKCNDCHGFAGKAYTVGGATSGISHVKDGGVVRECTYCHLAGHPQSPDGVTSGAATALMINNNPAVGINYRSGGIHIRKVIGGRSQMNSGEAIDTLAETCWGCHEDNGISEWGTNNQAATGNSPYNYGTLSQTNWVGAIWSSGYGQASGDPFYYKRGYIQSTHTANPDGTSAVTWNSARGRYDETTDTVDKIRCSYCHDVHDSNLAPNDTMSGRPYLRGTWKGNPYEEDGAPWNKAYTIPTYSPSGAGSNRYGAVPRGGSAYDELGGYYIDQNNVRPGTGNTTRTAARYPTSGWTLENSAGLCTICHGTNIDAMDQRTGESLWLGTNGHSNSAIGGAFVSAANIFDFTHGRPVPVTYGDKVNRNSPFANQVPSMGYISQEETDANAEGHGYRGTDSATYTGGYIPYTNPGGKGYGFLDYDWGASVDADSTDAMYHQFSCSKCHNPHASRLPKLMITNCLDVRHNTWDDGKSSIQSKYTNSALTAADRNMPAAYYASAQNCHRFDGRRTEGATDADDSRLRGGWNKVTPWVFDNLNNAEHKGSKDPAYISRPSN